ncbi:Fur-regulated basic protein FbpA [Aureibacillus halotolerans]|uniref:Fur-regulated basic protein A n=1 Tax=Aureibacillus halotolerans TaxID=1508390 RepID=A0A4V3D547_9BACI|nr:Fur-regulated basic protein FbpA [Aureibacillus halotolerans]TDQ38717.1 Fur-regulated basic protein A [Aureibacillus halotolerans]
MGLFQRKSTNELNKAKLIESLLDSGVYKMSDGRQLYESNVAELTEAYKLHADHCWDSIYIN